MSALTHPISIVFPEDIWLLATDPKEGRALPNHVEIQCELAGMHKRIDKLSKELGERVSQIKTATSYIGWAVGALARHVDRVVRPVLSAASWYTGVTTLVTGVLDLYWAYQRFVFFKKISQNVSGEEDKVAAIEEHLLSAHKFSDNEQKTLEDNLEKFSRQDVVSQFNEIATVYGNALSDQEVYQADIAQRMRGIFYSFFGKEAPEIDGDLLEQADVFGEWLDIKVQLSQGHDPKEILAHAKNRILREKVIKNKLASIKRIVSGRLLDDTVKHGHLFNTTQESHRIECIHLYDTIYQDYKDTGHSKIQAGIFKVVGGLCGIFAMLAITGVLVRTLVTLTQASARAFIGKEQIVWLTGLSQKEAGDPVNKKVRNIFRVVRGLSPLAERARIDQIYHAHHVLYQGALKKKTQLPQRQKTRGKILALAKTLYNNGLWQGLRALAGLSVKSVTGYQSRFFV